MVDLLDEEARANHVPDRAAGVSGTPGICLAQVEVCFNQARSL
jgi:hypothetical protein